jgi:hypothetical protein
MSVSRLNGIYNNPFFRRELERKERKACTLLLLTANTAYVLLFLGVRVLADLGPPPADGQALRAEFNYAPWFLVGGVLLSLSAHWLVPPLLLSVLRRDYEIGPVVLMVRGRHSEEEIYQGQVAAGLAPLVLGVLPYLVGLPLIAAYGPQHALGVLAALLAAVFWGSLCAGVSLWSGVRCRALPVATLCAYVLISLALPTVIGLVTAVIAHGCSKGQENEAFVFTTSAVLTWSILVIGTAAAFWDAGFGRLFPHKRPGLGQEPVSAPRRED